MTTNDPSARIETPRLLLRAPGPDDAPRIAALADDIGVARMTSRLPHPYGRQDAEAFLAHIAAAGPEGEHAFGIEHANDGLIGMIGLHSQGGLGPEIGYWLGRAYWGRGFATEAARAALDWARDVWRRRVLVAGHFADNPASGQVLVKAGFLYTGEVERRYSLARGEVAPTRMMVWLA
jgi:RimJ/RimL family protein N-acetyltransferase